MSDIRAQFGKAKMGTYDGPKAPRRLKGDKATAPEVFRVMPPMKSLVDSGKWAIYHAQHFGYKVEKKGDQGKLVMRPFGCVRKKGRDGIILQDCEECLKREEQIALRDDREAKLKAEGKSKEEIEQILEPLTDWCKEHSLDGKWYIGVKSLAGEFDALAIPHKMKKELDARIEELRKKGIDAFDMDGGVFFHFKRTGTQVSDMNFSVLIYKEEVNVGGEMLEKTKSAPLSDDDLKKALAEIPDLALEVVRYITPEQVKQLAEGSGDPEDVEAILSPPKEASKTEEKRSTKAVEKPAEEKKPAPKQETAKAAEPAEDDEEAQLQKQLAEAQARKAAKAAAAKEVAAKTEAKTEVKVEAKAEEKPKSTGAPKMATGGKSPDEMSDEEFAEFYK